VKVSWHWKSVVELDQLWMPKCLKLGWMLTFSPSINESGMWKRLYIENMVALQSTLRHVSYILLLLWQFDWWCKWCTDTSWDMKYLVNVCSPLSTFVLRVLMLFDSAREGCKVNQIDLQKFWKIGQWNKSEMYFRSWLCCDALLQSYWIYGICWPISYMASVSNLVTLCITCTKLFFLVYWIKANYWLNLK